MGDQIILTRKQIEEMQDQMNEILTQQKRLNFWLGIGLGFVTGVICGFLLWFGL